MNLSINYIGSPASNGKSTFNNVHLINADCVDKISVDERSTVDGLCPVDLHMVTNI